MRKLLVLIALAGVSGTVGWHYWTNHPPAPPAASGWRKLTTDTPGLASLDSVLSGADDPLLTVSRRELDQKRKSKGEPPAKIDHVAVLSPPYKEDALPRRVSVPADAEAEISFCVVQDENGRMQVVYRSETIARSLEVPRIATGRRQMLVVYWFPLTRSAGEFVERAEPDDLLVFDEDRD